MTEPQKRDVVSEARRVLRDASRVHALHDADPKKDEDVSWLVEALADECERLRRWETEARTQAPRCATCGAVIASHCTKCMRDWES